MVLSDRFVCVSVWQRLFKFSEIQSATICNGKKRYFQTSNICQTIATNVLISSYYG